MSTARSLPGIEDPESSGCEALQAPIFCENMHHGAYFNFSENLEGQIMKFPKFFIVPALALTFSFALVACNNSKEVVSENGDSTKDLNVSEEANQTSDKSKEAVSAPKALSSFSSEQQGAVKILRETEVGNGITVVNSGSGEKKVYSYTIPENSTANAEMKVKMGSSNVINGQQVPSPPIPAIVTPMEFKTGKNEQGKVKVEATYLQARIEEDASVPDFLKEATLNQMNRLKDITMSWNVNPQGSISNVSFPDNLPPDLKSLFEQTQRSIGNMFVGLPTEAIGKNSSWILGIDSFNIGGIEQKLRILYLSLIHI